MSDAIFPKGMFFNLPKDNAPDFVKGRLSINLQELIEWLTEQEGEKIEIDLLVSGKTGKGYTKVNTYKKDEQRQPDQDTRRTEEDLF